MTAADRIEALGDGERRARAERGARVPGGLVERAVDLTAAAAWIDARARAGERGALPLLVTRAAAIALARRPELHTSVFGYRTLHHGAVDVRCASPELGDEAVLFASAERQTLAKLALRAASAAAMATAARAHARGASRGWIVSKLTNVVSLLTNSLRFLQQWLAALFGRVRARAGQGTFEITCTPHADLVAPLRFPNGSALGAGRLRAVTVARDGRVETRRVVSLTLVADHVAMDGVRAAALLNEIGGVLEGGELAAEMT